MRCAFAAPGDSEQICPAVCTKLAGWRVGFRWSFAGPRRIVRLHTREAPASPISDWEGNAAHEQAAICRGRGEFADADRGPEGGRADRAQVAEGTGGSGADRRHRA